MQTISLPPYKHAAFKAYEQVMGFRPLYAGWAKAEMFLGLLAVGGSLVLIRDRSNDVIAIALFVLGGYLCMAGCRSLLYQSMNRQAAYFAMLTLQHQQGPDSNP